MQITTTTNPSLDIRQSVLYFQFRFMGWTDKELETQDDRYGTIPAGYVIGYESDRIVGAINLHKRKITIDNKEIILGGIGGVCTHKDYRNQKIASKLLKTAMTILKELDCDIAYLCSSIKPEFYSKFGFQIYKGDYIATGKSKNTYQGSNAMLAPLNSPDIFKNIIKSDKILNLQGQDW